MYERETHQPMDESHLDCTGRQRRFRLSCDLGGGTEWLFATELIGGEARGMRIVMPAKPDGTLPWGEIRTKLRQRLAERSTAMNPESAERTLLANVVRAQLTEPTDRETEPAGPNLLVDGEEISWHELGRLLMPYMGFGLRVEVCDAGEE